MQVQRQQEKQTHGHYAGSEFHSQNLMIKATLTAQALIHMLHNWSKETDGNGVTVRAILFDYKKAFDLIDHRILVEKLCRLNLPTRIINWIIYLIGHLASRKKGRHISRVFIFGIWVQNYFLRELIFAKMKKKTHFTSRILLLFYTSYCRKSSTNNNFRDMGAKLFS